MPKKPAAPTRTAPLSVRIPPALVARVDRVRPDLVPREAFIRALLDKALTAEEKKS
jgi:hypothetical protein